MKTLTIQVPEGLKIENIERIINALNCSVIDYKEDDETDPFALSAEEWEAIDAGLQDIEEGRVLSNDEVFKTIQQLCKQK